MPRSASSARERALDRAAEAGGATLRPLPADYNPVRTPNDAANRSDVIRMRPGGKTTGKGFGRRYVVTNVTALPDGWGYDLLLLRGKASDPVKSLGEASYTTTLPGAALRAEGRWIGDLHEGATGRISERPENLNTNKTADETAGKGSATMATVTRSKAKGKPAATKKAAAKPAAAESTRRSREDIDAIVPDIVEALQAGDTMTAVKERFGFSHGQPIRQALARNGYDSKGNALEDEEPITGSGKTLAKKVAAERAKGVAWYLLARRTDKSESELRTLLEENGYEATGRTYAAAAPKPKAEPVKGAAAGKTAGKPAAKKATTSAAKKAKAKAADPS